jgi:hypothetical protein
MDAEATMSTGEAVVSPAVGAETPTPAKANAVERIIVAAIWKYLVKTEPSKETDILVNLERLLAQSSTPQPLKHLFFDRLSP